MGKRKLFNRFLPAAFLALFVGNLFFLNLVVVTPVSAAYPSTDELRKRAQTIIQAEALRQCVRIDHNGRFRWDGVKPGESPMNDGLGQPTYDIAVGPAITNNEGGKKNCSEDKDWFWSVLYKNGSDTDKYSGWADYRATASLNLRDITGKNELLRYINANNDASCSSSDCGGPIDNNRQRVMDKIDAQINHVIAKNQDDLSQEAKNAMKYINIWDNFINNNGCQAKVVADQSGGGAFVTQVGGLTFSVRSNSNDNISVGFGNYGSSDGTYNCNEMAAELRKYDADFRKVTGQPADTSIPTVPPGGSTATGTTGTGAIDANTNGTCEGGGGSLGWIMCPVIVAVGGALNWVDTQISRLMEVDRDKYTNDNDKMYTAWSRFRNIGLSILVITMLIMVLGTAVGGNMLDAYTVKKVMPRLFAAIIFMVLSWWFCIYLIDFFNVLGRGILGIMTAPFGLKSQTLAGLFDPSIGGAAIQIGGAQLTIGVVAFSPTILGILASFFGTALLIMGVAFLILTARQLFILVLILFSPIAILGWIFPNGSKLWKAWWETISKLLLMYPMVMAVLASGRIFASVIGNMPASGAEGGLLNPILKLVAYVIPYAFIPFTFKAAGGVFGNLTGMVNDRSKGAFDRLRKGRQESYKRTGELAKSGQLFRGGENNPYNRVSQQLMHANKAGLRPSMWGANLSSAINTTESQEIGKALEDAEYAPIKGDDTLNSLLAEWAHTGSADPNKLRAIIMDFKDKEGKMYADGDMDTINQAVVYGTRMRKKMSGAAFEQMAVGQAIAGGTIYSEKEAWAAAARASHGNQAALAAMTNKGRTAAMNAGRVDTGGASFGGTMGYANALGRLEQDFQRGVITRQQHDQRAAELTAEFHNQVLESQGPGTLVHPSMKPRAIEALMPALQQRLETAYASGDQPTIDRELAMVSSIHDQLAQTAPNKARIIAKNLLEWTPPTLAAKAAYQPLPSGVAGPPRPAPTIQAEVSRAKTTDAFQATHKEYMDSYATEEARRRGLLQGGQQTPGGPATPPIGGPPIGGSPIGP